MTFRQTDLKYLINEHGKDCTFLAKSLGTYDATTGTLSGGSSRSYTMKMYFSNYNIQDIDGSKIVLGDRRALLLNEDIYGLPTPEPDIGDEIVGENDKVSIVSVQKLMSSNTVLCYICQVRE